MTVKSSSSLSIATKTWVDSSLPMSWITELRLPHHSQHCLDHVHPRLPVRHSVLNNHIRDLIHS
eukprot:6606954-Karenia_brevis.AAC.1